LPTFVQNTVLGLKWKTFVLPNIVGTVESSEGHHLLVLTL